MSADRELLEAAAHAYWAGEIDDVVSLGWSADPEAVEYTHADNQDHNGRDVTLLWNPLVDGDQALRLASKLRLVILIEEHFVRIGPRLSYPDLSFSEDWTEEQRCDVVRRAITMAAAQIGAVA